MKALSIGFNYYEYPEGIASLEEFVQFLKDNYYSFIKLKQWQTDKCCYPYFIESEYEWVYLNVAQLREVSETREDVTVLPMEEYVERLKKVVAEKCVHCEGYYEDCEGDNLEGHYSMIILDGQCYSYKKVKSSE